MAKGVNENLNSANSNAQDLKESLREVLYESRNIVKELELLNKVSEELKISAINVQGIAKAWKDVDNATRDIAREIENIVRGTASVKDLNKQVEEHRRAEKNLLLEAEQALFGMSGFQSDIAESLVSSEALYKALYDNIDSLSVKELQLLQIFADQLAIIEEENETFAELGKRAKVISDNIGIIPKLGNILADVIGPKAANALGLTDAFKQSRMLAAELTKGGRVGAGFAGKAQIAGKFLQSVASSLLKTLGPITLLKEFIEGFKAADTSITNLAKSFAISKDAAQEIYSNMGQVAAATADINITTEKLAKSFSNLNSELGFLSNVTGDTLVTMTRLTELVGLSAKEASALVALSEARGTSLKDEEKSILGASYELQRQKGTAFSLAEILKSVASVTGQIRANLQANPAEIARAVTLAKQLGGTLDDVKSISKGILDFESSIAAELEAEVLTGRELNLERARLAALNGDIVELTREITSQVGTFTEFSKMNVIQQNALAKAFNLSADVMSDMLFKQQIMGKNAQQLRAAGEEELARMLEQQSMQDKFNQSVEKLKGMFADLGGALLPFVDVLGFAFSIVGQIAALIMDIARFFKGDFDFSSTREAGESIMNRYFSGGDFSSTGVGSNGIVSNRSQTRNSMPSSDNSRMVSLLEIIAAKPTDIYMNDDKLNNSFKIAGAAYSVGS